MLQRDFYLTRSDGVNLYRTYSDTNMYILQNDTGITYTEAVDVEDTPHTYSETNTPIPLDELSESDDIDSEYAAAGRILMGAEQ